MIYIDTGHHSRRSRDGRHCACLVNLQRSVLFTRVVHGERTLCCCSRTICRDTGTTSASKLASHCMILIPNGTRPLS